MASQQKLFLVGSKNTLTSYELPVAFSEAIALISSGDLNISKQLNKLDNHSDHDRLARVLDGIDMKEKAFEVVKSLDFKFELAIQLNFMDEALELARESSTVKRWKETGDLCMNNGRFDDCEECYKAANDIASLFLLYTSMGDKEGMEWLVEQS